MKACDVLAGDRHWSVEHSDAGEWLDSLPPASLDLVFGSPPYGKARKYLEDDADLGIARDTEDWVVWMASLTHKALRACRGLVAWVVEGETEKFSYTAAPFLLVADLHRSGVVLRKPPIFHRVGIPGSGGPDWLRNDYELIVCATNGGRLPWADNTVMGGAPKYPPGGAMSYRNREGQRKNAQDGPKAKARRKKNFGHTKAGKVKGEHDRLLALERTNPGNVIKCAVGGGVMGNPLCHKNEAPFPESLAEFFIRSFCPEGGIVADCFSGSGTTAAVAVRWHRKAIACDLRDSQVALSRRRIAVEESLFHSTQES